MTVARGHHGTRRLGERRRRRVRADVARAWAIVEDVGGAHGWYANTRLWSVRAALDRLIGGPGMRGRPRRPLRAGDIVDFWVVEAIEQGRSLTLRAQMRMPGTARMTLTVTPQPTDRRRRPPFRRRRSPSSVIEQAITFDARGLAGLTYWYGQLPAHRLVFTAMLRGMVRAAERG